MPVANTKNLKQSIVSFMRARPGQRFENPDIARQFDADFKTTRKILLDLVLAEEIDSVMISGHRYYVFSGEAKSAQPAAMTMEIRPAWRMPPVMLDRMHEVEAHRAKFPSHFAAATKA